MDIKDILNTLNLDLTNSETKRGAIEAIKAILDSRQSNMSLDDAGISGANGDENEVEIDPDLLQPSVKQQAQGNVDDDVEIDDEEDILSQVKYNDAEENTNVEPDGEKSSDSQNTNSNTDFEDLEDFGLENDENASTDETSNSSTDSEEAIADDDQDTNDNILGDLESQDKSDTEDESDLETPTDPDDSETIDEEDLLDDTLKGIYDDEAIKTKHEARKIKRERTLQAAKTALEKAKAKKTSDALIRELESAIADLESLTEAVTKSIKDISDEEFNLLINRVFDAIEAVGDSDLTYKSEEEREAQAQEIKTDISNTATQQELSAEDIAQIRAETQAVKAREKENAKYAARAAASFKGFQDFINSLYRAIALQVHTEETRDDSWSAISRRNSGAGVLQQGKKLNELPNKKIPVIDFYFDQSASWAEKDIKVGEKAVQRLAEMEKNGQIKINIFYFANHVYSDAFDARAEGGTRAWNDIVRNVIATQATNVIIMTDSDMEDRWGREPNALTYTVPGYVWYLWRNGVNAPRLPRDLKGRGGTQQFSFSASDI